MKENFRAVIPVEITLGHLLALWQLISDKLADEPINKNFTEIEKRVIWAFQDICERELENNNIKAKPEEEWNQLVRKAHEHVKTIEVEFLD